MGSQIDIYAVYSLSAEGNACDVLLRFQRRSFSNSSEPDHSAAIDEAYARRDRLLRHAISALQLPPDSNAELVGELQGIPAGDEIFSAQDGDKLDVWLAPAFHSHPWIVLGTAQNENEFWRVLENEPDLVSLNPRAPAQLRHVYFFSDRVLGS